MLRNAYSFNKSLEKCLGIINIKIRRLVGGEGVNNPRFSYGNRTLSLLNLSLKYMGTNCIILCTFLHVFILHTFLKHEKNVYTMLNTVLALPLDILSQSLSQKKKNNKIAYDSDRKVQTFPYTSQASWPHIFTCLQTSSKE